MGIIDLVITAVALSMDAFAVAIGKGLATRQVRIKHSLLVGAYFGGFQALMPLLGYLLASSFQSYICAYDHWIAFGLLFLIGANMVKEAFSSEEDELDDSFAVRAMLPLAIATSIDALASGVTFAVTGADIFAAIAMIGVITFAFSAAGVKLGNIFGAKYRSKAELLGGIVLILMGAKILIEHLTGAA